MIGHVYYVEFVLNDVMYNILIELSIKICLGLKGGQMITNICCRYLYSIL